MNWRIKTYDLQVAASCAIEMHSRAVCLGTSLRRTTGQTADRPASVIILEDTKTPIIKRTFCVYADGCAIPQEEERNYLGTVQPVPDLILHVFGDIEMQRENEQFWGLYK